MTAQAIRHNRFALYAWFVLGYNVVVILWGALVRATGSGAGCGGHWPLCNGQVVPVAPQIETVIEFTHRMMSGLSLVLVLLLAVWVWRRFGKGHPVRAGAVGSVVFILTEALLGAGLVLFGWVAGNVSVARTVSVSLHLVNTFLLLSVLTLTAWWASGGAPVSLRGQSARAWVLAVALLGVLFIGVSGAITALGDTLFPSGSLASGMQQDLMPTANFLIRLRVIHPLIAVAVGVYLWVVGSALDQGHEKLARTLQVLVVVQLGAGAVNVVLLAPVPMQLVHLLLADLVWITLVLFSASLLPVQNESVESTDVGTPAKLGTSTV